jgi:hypothetical protein
METAILTIKIYGNVERALSSASFMLENELKDLDAKAEVSLGPDGWLQVAATGDDGEFAINFLKEKFGTPVTYVDDKAVYRGFISSIDEDGITVDIGITLKIKSSELSVLGAGTSPQIASRFGLIPHLPVYIRVLKQEDGTFASFTKKQVDLFWSWKKLPTDRLTVNSVTRSELKSAIKKKGHGRDIYGIERLGLLENLVVCREKTDGPGIVAEIGPLLNAEIGVIKGTR